jgi:hypothetical protein
MFPTCRIVLKTLTDRWQACEKLAEVVVAGGTPRRPSSFHSAQIMVAVPIYNIAILPN